MSIPVHMRKGINYSGNSFSATYADSVIGAILPYGGATAPYGWFLCQGQAISRTEYSELFEVIGTSFGAGDGSTTFNLPDLRGEFLRGAGNNSHANQGNGGVVGVHQDGTGSPIMNGGETNLGIRVKTNPRGEIFSMFENVDSTYGDGYYRYIAGSNTAEAYNPATYTSRPTNTSVNFIIKAKYSASPAGDVLGVQDIRDTLGETPIPSDLGTTVTGALSNIGNRFNYSTEEQVVGKWIDGKPLYQKTINIGSLPNATQKYISIGVSNIDKVTYYWGFASNSRDDKFVISLPASSPVAVENAIMVTTSIYNGVHSIRIWTGVDQSSLSGYVTIQYTKTTD